MENVKRELRVVQQDGRVVKVGEEERGYKIKHCKKKVPKGCIFD